SGRLRDASAAPRATAAPGQPLLGVGVALPGPVEFPTGRVVGPARMPGWSGVDPDDYLRQSFGDVRGPVIVDNDAKAAAIGEYSMRELEPRELAGDTIYLQAGTAIRA